MTISLTTIKKQKLLSFCDELLSVQKTTIRKLAQLLGKFSSSFIAVTFGKLHYRSLERCKTNELKLNKGNFDKIITISSSAKEDIQWWRSNIMESYSQILKPTPTLVINTDASSFGWGASFNTIKTGGYFSVDECQFHINI